MVSLKSCIRIAYMEKDLLTPRGVVTFRGHLGIVRGRPFEKRAFEHRLAVWQPVDARPVLEVLVRSAKAGLETVCGRAPKCLLRQGCTPRSSPNSQTPNAISLAF